MRYPTCITSSSVGRILGFIALGLALAASGSAQADIPTAEQECEGRNQAICEVNGLVYQQSQECPAETKTLRPLGKEDCHRAAISTQNEGRPANATQAAPPAPHPATATNTPTRPANDMARYAATERWLMPLIVIGGGALLAVLILVALIRFFRAQRQTQGAIVSFLIKSLIASSVAARVAQAVLQQVFEELIGKSNHDTAAPVLLAAPPALFAAGGAFLLTAAAIFLLLSWLESRWRGKKR